jgi:parallel beta-helix repeat protein
LLYDSSNYNSVSGNNITANYQFGIGFGLSSNNSISGNNITNSGYGIILEDCLNNSISGNNITNSDSGIRLSNSSNNGIFENTLTYGSDGIVLYDSSNYNVISGNKITNNSAGIWLSFSSNNNSISANSVIYNDDGVHLYHSSNNTIYHNNFINNTKQVSTVASLDFWDGGYPSGGNYWSDYVGVDVKSGPSQNLPGSDGIGDTPYIIDANNTDHYPLMNPYGAPPPPTYTLTITATVGGTTDPAAGTYGYTANSTVQVTATPEVNYLFDHWELDDVNVGSANPYSLLMDKGYELKAVFSPIPPPLSVSISPLSSSILAGQSATFTSTVSGGYTPYSYQWCLNGNPVSGATSSSWAFTPTTSGIYYVYLKVTDSKSNMAQSETTRITVATVPVGGYSFSIQGHTTANPLIHYLALVAILTVAFTAIKSKTQRRTKHS